MARAKETQPIDEQPIEQPIEEPKTVEEAIEPETVEEVIEKEEAKKAQPKKQKEWKILAPNKDYTGVAATVEFKDGIGFTSNEVIKNYFEAKGFKIL